MQSRSRKTDELLFTRLRRSFQVMEDVEGTRRSKLVSHKVAIYKLTRANAASSERGVCTAHCRSAGHAL